MKKGQRALAFTAAVLFFLTSVGFSIAVIWQANREQKRQAELNSSLDQFKTPQEAGLKGTKLNDFTPVAKTESLQKTDLIVGTGDEVQPGASITAHYTGALASDGTIFESSHDRGQPLEDYPLASLIKGWQDGIPGMKVGGKRRLIIPAAEAYGEQEQEGIPANSDLVFDIELISIGSAPQ